MKGNNSFEWCAATMHAAVQHYLDTVLLKEPGKQQVISVRGRDESGRVSFVVDVKSADED